MIKPLSLCDESLVTLFIDMVMSRYMGLPDSRLVATKAWYSLLDGWHYTALMTYRNSGKVTNASFDIPEKELKQIIAEAKAKGNS